MTRPNGHAPAPPDLVDVAAILERSPHRTLRVRRDALSAESVSPWELSVVGRALELTPTELVAILQDKQRSGWAALEVWQALAWVIARRVEPGLTWEVARTFALDWGDEPDPTAPRAPRRSGRRGTATSSERSG